MAKNIHQGHRARMREVMRNVGLENMQEHQVLEYLLSFVVAQRDTNPTAHKLIERFGSFGEVLEASRNDLMQVDGVGDVVATFLSTFRDFYHYYNSHRKKLVYCINTTPDAVFFMRKILAGKSVEEFYVAALDGKGYVVAHKRMGTGSLTKVNVNIRDIIKFALDNNVNKIMIGHNHPDGDCTPSAEDLQFTDALKDALRYADIEMLEHIIVGKDKSYSYRSGRTMRVGHEYEDIND